MKVIYLDLQVNEDGNESWERGECRSCRKSESEEVSAITVTTDADRTGIMASRWTDPTKVHLTQLTG